MGALHHPRDNQAPVGMWDLYQYQPRPEDELHVLPFTGAYPQEVHVYHDLPPDAIWYVASREWTELDLRQSVRLV